MNLATAREAFAITPDNDTVIACRAIYVGGAGDVAVVPYGQTTPVIFYGVPAGTLLPIACNRVRATSTDATNIVGLV